MQTTYDKNWAAVMKRTLNVTRLPLISIGLASDRYTGTTIAAIPTPNYTNLHTETLTPTNTLPMIKTGIVGANPMTIAPAMNKISAIIIVGFLP